MAHELSGFISVFQLCSAPHVCSWVWAGQGAGACAGMGAKSQNSHIRSHPSSGDSRKSHRSPLTPCSCTFPVLVLPLPGSSSNTNATLSRFLAALPTPAGLRAWPLPRSPAGQLAHKFYAQLERFSSLSIRDRTVNR